MYLNKIKTSIENCYGIITNNDIISFTSEIKTNIINHTICSNVPRISIIMPSYNSVRFIEKSILSVLNQNYDNIELIIIDGGSKDGTVDVIK